MMRTMDAQDDKLEAVGEKNQVKLSKMEMKIENIVKVIDDYNLDSITKKADMLFT